MSTIPASVSDVLLHEKNSDRTEKVIMPVTRYKNVLNAPTVVSSTGAVAGAPFILLCTDKETLTISELRKLSSDII